MMKLHVTKQRDVFAWHQKISNYILPSKAQPFLQPFLERIVSKIIHCIQDKRNFVQQVIRMLQKKTVKKYLIKSTQFQKNISVLRFLKFQNRLSCLLSVLKKSPIDLEIYQII